MTMTVRAGSRVLAAWGPAAAPGDVGAVHAAPLISQAGNLLTDGDFEAGTSGVAHHGVATGGASALGNWDEYSNSHGVDSEGVDAPLIEGSHTARVAGGVNDGLYPYMNLAGGTYTVSGWLYVVTGAAHLAVAWNGGTSSSLNRSTTISTSGDWVYVSETVSGVGGSLGGAVVYAAAGGSEFLAEGLWLDAGERSTSPFDPSQGFDPDPHGDTAPEPGTLLLAGLACGALAARPRRRLD